MAVSSTIALRRRWPWHGSGYERLSRLLVLLTFTTGVVDAVSYLTFGHVFVANMTGNVVFLAFALAGASGLSASASLVALGAFLLGAALGGRIALAQGEDHGRHLRVATGLALAMLIGSIVLAALVGKPLPEGARYALIVALALAMGVQNATARRLAVPDLTTTVLTLTLTGVAADSRAAGGEGGRPGRRLIAVGAMFCGALAGALLVLEVDVAVPLALAAVAVAVCTVGAHRLTTSAPDA